MKYYAVSLWYGKSITIQAASKKEALNIATNLDFNPEYAFWQEDKLVWSRCLKRTKPIVQPYGA